MALFTSDSRMRAPETERRKRPSFAIGVWAAIALITLAILSVAAGVAPAIDPAIFAAP